MKRKNPSDRGGAHWGGKRNTTIPDYTAPHACFKILPCRCNDQGLGGIRKYEEHLNNEREKLREPVKELVS